MPKTKTETTAKVTTTHDRITVRVDFPAGDRLNLTYSRRGKAVSGSGPGVAVDHLHAAMAVMESERTGTYGEQAEALAVRFRTFKTVGEVIASKAGA